MMKPVMKPALLLSAALLVAMAGCAKEEAASTDPAPSDETTSPSALGIRLGGQTKDALASTFADQVDQADSLLGPLKDQAGTWSDQKLDELITKADEKLVAARAKLDELKNAEGGTADALQEEVKELMQEAQELIKQGTSRLGELAGSSLPGGVKLPGQ